MTDPRSVSAADPNGGRRRDFTDMFHDQYGGLYAYALRRSSPEDAEEVVSETFAVAWRRWDEVPRDHVRPWLYGVARKVLANHRRGRSRRERLLGRMRLQRFGEEEVAPTQSEALEASHELHEAWKTLREADREVLLLAAWEQLDHVGIAAVLDCSPGAARVRLHRARKRLEAALGQAAAGPVRTGEHHDD